MYPTQFARQPDKERVPHHSALDPQQAQNSGVGLAAEVVEAHKSQC